MIVFRKVLDLRAGGPSDFRVSIDDGCDTGRVLVDVCGDVDLSTEALLQIALRAAASRYRPLVVDLTRASYFGACGLHCLQEVDKSLVTEQLTLVAPPHSSAARLLRSIGMADRWPTLPAVDPRSRV